MSAKAPGVFQSRLPDLEESRTLARAILARGDCLTLQDMALDGEGLKALGVPSGPKMGELLHRLLESVWEGTVPNQKEALEAFARRLINQEKE